MIEYYTPSQLAHFVFESDLEIKTICNLIQELYLKEYSFIDSKYQNDKELFLKEVLTYTYFLTFKDIFEKEIKKDKHNDYLVKYKHFMDIQPNFFLITRLILLFNKKNRLIKLRTLLKMYGYKRRNNKIISLFHDNFIFYHLKTYYKNELKDISEFEIDEWITIKL